MNFISLFYFLSLTCLLFAHQLIKFILEYVQVLDSSRLLLKYYYRWTSRQSPRQHHIDHPMEQRFIESSYTRLTEVYGKTKIKFYDHSSLFTFLRLVYVLKIWFVDFKILGFETWALTCNQLLNQEPEPFESKVKI